MAGQGHGRGRRSGSRANRSPSSHDHRRGSVSPASSSSASDNTNTLPPPAQLVIMPPSRIPTPRLEYADVTRDRRTPSPDYDAAFPRIQDSVARVARSRGSRSSPAADTPSPPMGQAASHTNPPLSSDPDTAFKQKFRKVLDSSRMSADGEVSHYRCMAQLNAKMKQKILEIDFEDILKEEYIDLAREIVERGRDNPHHSWLQSVAQEFLNAEFNFQTKKEIQSLGFHFIRCPKSIKPLSGFKTEAVVAKQRLYDGAYQVVKTELTGRLLYLSVINHTLAVHKKGRSYNGEWRGEDVYILEYQGKSRFRCLIFSRTIPVYENDLNPKVLDLKRINLELTPRYMLDGEWPAYFIDLQDDLEGLTSSKLRDTGILVVLAFHYSVMPPGAWGFLLWKLHLVIQQLRLSGSDFGTVFGRTIGDEKYDWRPEFRESEDKVVKGVYNHDNLDENKDKFSNDLLGMVGCERHLVQHAHHHPKDRPVRVKEKDENELFAALKMPHVLPRVVRGLFTEKEMQFEKQLGEVYDFYCRLGYGVDEEEEEWTNLLT